MRTAAAGTDGAACCNGRAGQRIHEGTTDPGCVAPRAGGMDVAFHVVVVAVDDEILVWIGSSFLS